MTTHYEKIQALGNRMVSNLETMGVSASFSDGGLTLADKILEIQHFTDGLLLWANKDIIQTGDTVTFNALLLDDKKGVSGETIFFYDSNNPPITRSSTQTHTLNVELGSSFKLIYQSSSTYGEGINLSNEDDSLLINYNGYNNNIYISINGGVPVTAFSCEGFLKLENGVLSDDGGHTYNLFSYNLNFKLKEMQTVGNNCSVYINPIGSAVTDANGVASVTYTGVGAGKLNVQAETSDGTLQSETFVIFDTLQHHFETPTLSELSVLTGNMDLSVDNGYVLAEQTSGTTGYFGISLNSNISDYAGETVRFEVNAIQNTNRGYFIRVYTKTSTVTSWTRVASQILDSNLVDLPYVYVDVEFPSDLTDIWFRIDANTQNANNIRIKDWKVYKI